MWSRHVWPAPEQAGHSLARWQPSPICPQYWPPGGVQDTGVQTEPSSCVMTMSIDGLTSMMGASTRCATSGTPPSLPPEPAGWVGLTPAEQPASSARTRTAPLKTFPHRDPPAVRGAVSMALAVSGAGLHGPRPHGPGGPIRLFAAPIAKRNARRESANARAVGSQQRVRRPQQWRLAVQVVRAQCDRRV